MSQEVTHTHILADYDDGYVLVVYAKGDVIDWIKVIENLQKES